MSMSNSFITTVRSVSTITIVLIVLLATTNSRHCTNAFFVSNHKPLRVRSSDELVGATSVRCDRQQRHRRFRIHSTSTDYQPQHQPQRQHKHGYELEANSDPDILEACRFTEDQIHDLIAKRLDCKKGRNFESADTILEALNTNGVYLQDKKRKYRVDGENHFGRRQRYLQRGACHGLSAEDRDTVQKLVEERARFKRIREYHRSDEITGILKDTHGVKVDDRRREWTVETKVGGGGGADSKGDETTNSLAGGYVPTPLAPMNHATHTMSDEIKEAIRDRLGERSMARRQKNYKMADQIRDELMEEYSIVIDDRTKEWKVVDDVDMDSFWEDRDDPFAREAQLSQRSAFVQKRDESPFDNHKNNYKNNIDSDENDETRTSNGDPDEVSANREDSLDEALSRIIMTNDADVDVDVNVDVDVDVDVDTVAAVPPPDPDPVPTDEASSPAPAPATIAMHEIPVGDTGESVAEGTTAGAITGEETYDELRSLTVVALREKLRMAGLPVSGLKSVLINRLLLTTSSE